MTDEMIYLEDEEKDALAQLVAEALLNGESRESVLADLSDNGVPEDEAEELVTVVELQLLPIDVDLRQSESSGSSEGGWGWLIWILVIVGFRILSALF